MRVLSRYIFKESLIYFLICLSTFTALILTARILKFANLIVNKGVEFDQILIVFLSIIPTFIEIALPMSVLLGLMLAFARLSGDSEIIVIRASGVSIKSLIKPVLLFGIIATVFAYYISFQLRPWGYQKLNQTLFEIARSKSTSGITAGLFNNIGKLTIYSDSIDYSTGALTNVIIDDKRNEGKRQIIFSDSGTITSNPKTQKILINLATGSIHEKESGQYNLTDFSTNRLVINPDDIYGDSRLEQDKRGRELSLANLIFAIKDLKADTRNTEYLKKLSKKKRLDLKKRYNRLKIEYALRFSMPWASFILALIALPLGIMPPRTQKTWGASFSLAVGVAMFLLYYAILTTGITLGESGVVNHHVAAWLPNLITLLIALFILKKTTSEKCQTITDVIDYYLGKFSRKEVAG